MANYPFTLNGDLYDENSFTGFAYVTGLPAALGDLVQHVLRRYSGLSATSLTIATGIQTLTTQQNRAFSVGDMVSIVSTAAPQTNKMIGIVTAYSGFSMSINVIKIYGSGTFASWVICLGGMSSSHVNDWMLALDNGGTGFGRDTFAKPVGFLGFDEPATCMSEIREEFAGSQGGAVVKAPWRAFYNSVAADLYSDPYTSTSLSAGYFGLAYDIASALISPSAYLRYGDSGFLHVGRGALVYETNVYGAGVFPYNCAIGLSNAPGSGLFADGGIGFTANSARNNGRYICTCGYAGKTKTINTGVVPSSGKDRLRFEVDHDGRQVDFFINGSFIGSLADSCPTTGANNLLAPAYETGIATDLTGTRVGSALHIDSLLVRKFLLR